MAKTHQLPLLLHCRDPPGRNQAILDTLNIVEQSGLSRESRVYLHCYSYGFAELHLWKSSFPNVVVGICTKVLNPKDRNPDLVSLIKCVGASRILLETDAPYFSLPRKGFPFGSPTQAYEVARQVAEWRGTSVATVLQDSARATLSFYGM